MRERTIVFSGLAALGISYVVSTGTFSATTKDSILKRDPECQSCGGPNEHSHHIVPECLENGNHHTDPRSDHYNEIFLHVYDSIINNLPESSINTFRKKVRGRIQSELNGIGLCKQCHTELHKFGPDGSSSMRVKKSDMHPERPLVFSKKRLVTYFIGNIINPSLEECDLQTLSEREIGEFIENYKSYFS